MNKEYIYRFGPDISIRICVDDDGGASVVSSGLHTASDDDDFCRMMDGVESLLLAMAGAGMDMNDPRIIQAVDETIHRCSNAID